MAPRLPTPQRAPRSPINRERVGAQRTQLLDALVSAYPSALPLARLREVAGARPGARVAELRKAGWAISTQTIDVESRLATYRLDSLQPREELEVHAAVTVYLDSAQGYHSRVHADLSGVYSDEDVCLAAREALVAFQRALSRSRKREVETPQAPAPVVKPTSPPRRVENDFVARLFAEAEARSEDEVDLSSSSTGELAWGAW